MARQLLGTSPRRLLVVDDEETQRRIIGNIASQCGFDVVTAPSVEAASLGSRDGIELLRFIGDSKLASGIIVISGCEERIMNATKDGGKTAPTTITQIVDAFDAVRKTYEEIWARGT